MRFEQFIADRRARDAVLFNFTVIGEAASAVPQDIRDGLPSIPWRKARGMRNVVAHEYFGTNEEIVWDTIQNDIPALITTLQAIPGVVCDPPAPDSESP